MEDKIYTEDEAYVLIRKEQIKVLKLRKIRFDIKDKESKLVTLILKSNPVEKEEIEVDLTEKDEETIATVKDATTATTIATHNCYRCSGTMHLVKDETRIFECEKCKGRERISTDN